MAKIKKILCALSAVTMLASALNVFAEQSVTGTTYWKQTYEGLGEYVMPDGMDLYINGSETEADAEAIDALKDNNVYIGGKTEVYGKEDSVFAVENTDVKYVANAATSKVTVSSAPKVILFGFDMAINDTNATEQINMICQRSSSKYPDYTVTRAIRFVNGKLDLVFGANAASEYTMQPKQWVRFDFVISDLATSKTAAASVDYYIDGKFEGRIQTTGTYKNISGITNAQFVYASGETGWYIDNLTTEKLTALPAVESTNEAVVVDNDARTVTAPASMTAADLQTALGGGDVVVLNEDKQAQSGAITDGYVYVPFSANNLSGCYYALTAVPVATDSVELNVVTDSATYTEDGVEVGVVGFKTIVTKQGNPAINSYGTFIVKAEDFDFNAGSPTEISKPGEPADGSYAVEVTGIDKDNYSTPIYAKSFVKSDSAWYYSNLVSGSVVNE